MALILFVLMGHFFELGRLGLISVMPDLFGTDVKGRPPLEGTTFISGTRRCFHKGKNKGSSNRIRKKKMKIKA